MASETLDEPVTTEPETGLAAPRPYLARACVTIPLSALDATAPLRVGVDPRHLAMIEELDGCWPPILVDAATHRILDGHYRVLAARRAGRTHVECEYFHGTGDDAFLEAVGRNRNHGLPLTLFERRRIAERLLSDHAEWSDRRVARIAGLSPSTVGAARRARAADTTPAVRVGRDGRARNVDRRLVRSRVASALDAMPLATLREVARLAGASPETVRSVRNERSLASSGATEPAARPRTADVAKDPVLTATPRGAAFVAWFGESTIEPDHFAYAAEVPLSRVYEIADEARRRASSWSAFADSLEARARQHKRC